MDRRRGNRHTPKTKAAISEKLKGRPCPPEKRKAISESVIAVQKKQPQFQSTKERRLEIQAAIDKLRKYYNDFK